MTSAIGFFNMSPRAGDVPEYLTKTRREAVSAAFSDIAVP